MNPIEIFLSKKVLRVLELFAWEEKEIPFSKVMMAWRFTSPESCWYFMGKLINGWLVNCAFINSTYIKI